MGTKWRSNSPSNLQMKPSDDSDVLTERLITGTVEEDATAVSSVELAEFVHESIRDQDEFEEQRTNPNDFTISEAMSKIGYGRTQWIMLFLCGICWGADAMEMMLCKSLDLC